MPQSLLETGQQARLVCGLETDQPSGVETRLSKGRGEEVGPGDAPQDRTWQAGGNPRSEKGRCRAVDRPVSAAGHLMQRPQDQSALGQGGVERGDSERQDAGRPAIPGFKMLDPGAQFGELGCRPA